MKQTTLDLNGPILAFQTQPAPVTTNNAGIATFVGICTAYFVGQVPTNTFATNTGIVTHRWYAVGVGALSDGSFKGATLSGTGTTTLTVSNTVNPTISDTQFYVEADYIPSAYQTSSPVTAGTARSTGNAVNEVLNSNVVTLTVNPSLSVATQPISTTVARGLTATFVVSPIITDSNFSNISYQWYIDGIPASNGTFSGNTINGATSNILTITTSTSTLAGTSNVYVVLSHPTAGNSPVTSDVVTLTVVGTQFLINFEEYNGTSVSNNFGSNLQTPYTYTNTTSGYPILCFYAPEGNVDLDLELYAAKGNDNRSYAGGEGGVSIIRFTAVKNEEYILAPLPRANESGAVYLYRKSRLIAVVGAGGDAGNNGNGGAGGGVNVSGANGTSVGSGSGGSAISAGSLPQTGIFGSATAQNPISGTGDTKASAPDGGRVLPCARGGYWRDQGKQPCEDLGNTKFYLDNGVLVTTSATINRGFKPGYGILQTSGAGISGGGNGGQGATGGQGGVNGPGGGGGSGYTDGSVTVVSTQQGGNNSIAKVVFKLTPPPTPAAPSPPPPPIQPTQPTQPVTVPVQVPAPVVVVEIGTGTVNQSLSAQLTGVIQQEANLASLYSGPDGRIQNIPAYLDAVNQLGAQRIALYDQISAANSFVYG